MEIIYSGTYASAFCWSNSPSHFAITQLAKVFPITFTEVRAISINSSIPRIAITGHKGNPNEDTVPNKITKDARGTPATPLLVSINVSPMISWVVNGICMPAACATNTLASDRYKVVPSRLNVYPVGNTNDTIFLGTPNFSMFSIAIGNADSELVVAKAMATGSETALMNCLIGMRRK